MTGAPHLASGSRLAVASLACGLLALALWIGVVFTAQFQAFDIQVNYPLLLAAAASSLGALVTAAMALRRLAGGGRRFRWIALLGLLLGLVLSVAAFFPLVFALVALLQR